MHIEGYYSSGEFAHLANITKKTLRYYDEKNILRPSLLTSSGSRFYTEEDLLRLQEILLLKFLGFSLNDIREMLLKETDKKHFGDFLRVQRKLVEDRIEQLMLVEQTLKDTEEEITRGQSINWQDMLDLIHVTGMENSMQNQYKNASNISARINLHSLYAENPQGWFEWIFENLGLTENMQVLEIGCGDGSLWEGKSLPKGARIVLSDISDGMIRDVRKKLANEDAAFSFTVCSAEALPFPDHSFDLVVANHVLFYCDDIEKALKEIRRVLKPSGRLIAGTYGKNHMKEISEMVASFDERIRLSDGHLYDRFGKENGAVILGSYFDRPEWKEYPDTLLVTEAEPLISYVLSCHGNQNQYIVDSYADFKNFVLKKTQKGFRISKEAGIFTANVKKM